MLKNVVKLENFHTFSRK